MESRCYYSYTVSFIDLRTIDGLLFDESVLLEHLAENTKIL
jgi:hypothetical protein